MLTSSAASVLPAVVRFLFRFPQYLGVIVGYMRRTELACLRHLYSVVSFSQVLFEESLSRGLLKTTGGYLIDLLVLHTLEQLSSSSQEMAPLLERVTTEGGGWAILRLIYGEESGKLVQ